MLEPGSGCGAVGTIITGDPGAEAGAVGGVSNSNTGSGIFTGALEISLSRFSMFMLISLTTTAASSSLFINLLMLLENDMLSSWSTFSSVIICICTFII